MEMLKEPDLNHISAGKSSPCILGIPAEEAITYGIVATALLAESDDPILPPALIMGLLVIYGMNRDKCNRSPRNMAPIRVF